MAGSTLDPDLIPEPDRQLGKGHGNNALGPGDISDTSSDVQGGVRAIEENVLPLDRGTNEDSDSHNIQVTHENPDSSGTGESSTAGRNADVDLAGDIEVDRIDAVNPDQDADVEEKQEDIPPMTRQFEERPHHRR
jgi:hypothetical protein